MRKENVFFDSNSYKWEEVAPGVSRQITGYNDEIMMVLVKFEEGAVGAKHSHPHSQSTFVKSGEFEFTAGEETRLVKEGDCLMFQPDEIHGAVCKKAGLLVDVFSPVRKDFL